MDGTYGTYATYGATGPRAACASLAAFFIVDGTRYSQYSCDPCNFMKSSPGAGHWMSIGRCSPFQKRI